MEKNIRNIVRKYAIYQWETWAAERAIVETDNLEEPIWNCKNITQEFVETYTTDILPEKVMRYYEAYIYNSVWCRNIWKWARQEFGGLKHDIYYVIM